MKGDPTLVLNAAKSFFGMAGSVFQTVPDDPRKRDEYLEARLGPVIAATTNLAFSIELFLKGVAILTKGEALRGHNLRKLFDDLPPDVRASIEDCYRFRVSHDEYQRFPTIILGYMKRDRPPTASEKRELAKLSTIGDDVLSLLDAHKDSFEAWRYLHEAAERNSQGCICVHWYRLGVFVNAIQDQFIPPAQRPNFVKK